MTDGSRYVSNVRVTDKAGNVLAAIGDTCERVPASSLASLAAREMNPYQLGVAAASPAEIIGTKAIRLVSTAPKPVKPKRHRAPTTEEDG